MVKKIFLAFFTCFSICLHAITGESTSQTTEKPTDKPFVIFTPPTGWKLAPTDQLPESMVTMVIGKGNHPLPPRLNLTTEPYTKSLKDYLKIVKNINSEHGYDWKDLGMIRTPSGNGNLSQVDTRSEWGEIREMRVILLKDKHIYILTALAMKEEFALFYKDFFTAFRSLQVVNSLYDLLTPQDKKQLQEAVAKLETEWQNNYANKVTAESTDKQVEILQQTFSSKEFQASVWAPFVTMFTQKYEAVGAEWQSIFLEKLEDQLMYMKN
jgi:hypothetical protein